MTKDMDMTTKDKAKDLRKEEAEKAAFAEKAACAEKAEKEEESR